MQQKADITIIDTTLRDGLQHEEHYMPLDTRLDIIHRLIDAGIREIEVGSFSHREYLPQFREIENLAYLLPRIPDVSYSFLALNRKAVERAIEMKAQGAPIDRVLTGQLATSASYARKNMNRTHEELFQEAKEMVELLHTGGIQRVCANVGTIFGCPIEGDIPLEKAYEFVNRLLDMGFDEIEHSDSDGTASPDRMSEYCQEIMHRWPDPSIHVMHIHDINGMGLASYCAAMEQGVRRFECTLGGIGGQPANRLDGVAVKGTGDYYYVQGRTGLVSLEDFSFMLSKMNYSSEVNVPKILALGEHMEHLLGRKLDSFTVAAGSGSPEVENESA